MNDNRKRARQTRHQATMHAYFLQVQLHTADYEKWLAFAEKNHAGDWKQTWDKFCAENPEIGEAVSRMPARQGQVATAKCVTSPGASASGALSGDGEK